MAGAGNRVSDWDTTLGVFCNPAAGGIVRVGAGCGFRAQAFAELRAFWEETADSEEHGGLPARVEWDLEGRADLLTTGAVVSAVAAPSRSIAPWVQRVSPGPFTRRLSEHRTRVAATLGEEVSVIHSGAAAAGAGDLVGDGRLKGISGIAKLR
jgi:hypothetical protein